MQSRELLHPGMNLHTTFPWVQRVNPLVYSQHFLTKKSGLNEAASTSRETEAIYEGGICRTANGTYYESDCVRRSSSLPHTDL